jgi:uncharacterized protein (DUF3084 family)
MSTFGWFAIVILPILGGLIAWAGDVIGYRLGKGRHSLFGLRPRSTARLIGVAVGVALPLIGVGAALLGSSEARDALFHIDELRQQEAKLTAQNRELEARQERTQRQARASEQRARDLRADLYATRETLGEARQRVAATHRELVGAQQEVRRASGKASVLQAVADRLKVSINTLDGELKRLQGKLVTLQEDLRQKREELGAKTAELATRQAEVNKAQADERAFREAYRDAVRLIDSPVELDKGYELVRIIDETGDTVADTEDGLIRLLFTASRAAEAHGATRGPTGLAVRPILPWPPGFSPGEGTPLPSPGEVVRAFARELQAAGKRTFVIGVRVARRMYRDEIAPVGVELWALPYVRVFLENDVIYTVKMDGALSESEVFSQLWNLLTKIVRREAREKGLLPDAATGEYGTASFSQLFEALREIRSHKGPVQVRVVAAADTYITDPLLIRIEVGKGGTAPGEQDRSGD